MPVSKIGVKPRPKTVKKNIDACPPKGLAFDNRAEAASVSRWFDVAVYAIVRERGFVN